MLKAEDRVILLLRTYYEARECWDDRSNGAGPKLMPRMWNEGSYVELERRLAALRDSSDRSLWFHVTRRYRDGDWITLTVPVRRTLKGPVFLLPSHCELAAGAVNVTEKHAAVKVYRWDEDVDQEQADEAVRYLVRRMYSGKRERIVVPDFYYQRALGKPLDNSSQLDDTSSRKRENCALGSGRR